MRSIKIPKVREFNFWREEEEEEKEEDERSFVYIFPRTWEISKKVHTFKVVYVQSVLILLFLN